MADFADGIAPKRYPCRRAQSCRRRSQSTGQENAHRPPQSQVDKSTYWSLDEGQWMPKEAECQPGLRDSPPAAEQNAFIGFKKFVDRGLEGLTFGGRRRILYEAEQQSKADVWRRWTGDAENLESTTSVPAQISAVEATRMVLRQAELLTLDVPSHIIASLFQEDDETATGGDSITDAMLAFGGACYFLPEIGDRLPSSASLFRPSPRPTRWLSLDWFKHSPYSPLQVEAADNLPGPPERWRAAFTDLMTVSLDRPLRPLSVSNLHRAYGSKMFERLQPGIDWVLSLQLNGVLPPLLPHLQSSRSGNNRDASSSRSVDRRNQRDFTQLVDEILRANRTENIRSLCNKRAETGNAGYMPRGCLNGGIAANVIRDSMAHAVGEVDKEYSGVCSQAIPASCNHAADTTSHARHFDGPNSLAKPAILYTEANTKTTRAPDGRVSTRTVLRNRYEDGTEEEYETVHSTNES